MAEERDVGVPVMLLREYVEKKTVSVETNTGETFVGQLMDADPSMNLVLNTVKATFPSGHSAQLESVYVRGQKIRIIQLPKEAENSVSFLVKENPPFGRGGRGGGRGRGRGRGGRGFRGRGGPRGGGGFRGRRSPDRRSPDRSSYRSSGSYGGGGYRR